MNRRVACLRILLFLFLPSLAACATDAGSRNSHAVIPDSPDSGVMVVYLPDRNLYFPAAQSTIVKSYSKSISQLPAEDAIWSAFHSLADNTPWIYRIVPIPSSDSISVSQAILHKLTSDPSVNVIVDVTPTFRFTPELKGLMLTVSVWIFRNLPSSIQTLKNKQLTETVALEHAGAPLTQAQMSLLRDKSPAAAAEWRAAIWFSHKAVRVRTALLLALARAVDNLRPFLRSPIAEKSQ